MSFYPGLIPRLICKTQLFRWDGGWPLEVEAPKKYKPREGVPNAFFQARGENFAIWGLSFV
jgi:hypothetical protein